jgi:membrane protein
MRYVTLIRDSFTHLRKNDPLILAAATAFFATFSISPILVILMNIFGLYFKNEEIREQFVEKLQSLFGRETSQYIEGVVGNFSVGRQDWLVTAGGFIFLLFVATTALKVVKQAINKMWLIQRKHVSRLKYTFKERSIAFLLIVFTGLLVTFSVVLDTTLALLYSYIDELLPTLQFYFIRLLNIFLSIIISTIWFLILFKILPDAKVHWRVAAFGGFVTAMLFSFGKWVLGKLLLYSFIANLFGPSASFVLILLFIFYSSFIFYFGAAVTYTFGAAINFPIHAGKYSEEYEIRLVHDDNSETAE